MSNEYKKVQRRNVFESLLLAASRPEIKAKRKELGRRLTLEERNEIVEKHVRRAKNTLRGIIIAGTFGVGVLAGHNSGKLPSANVKVEETDKNVKIDATKADKNKDIDMKIARNDKRDLFINGIKVEFNEVNQNETIEETVEKEVNKLSNKEDVLNYLKGLYIDNYNNEHQKGLTAQNVELYKTRTDNLKDYKDIAGNKYYKVTSENTGNIEKDYGVIRATVKDGNRVVKNEYAVNGNGDYSEYMPVYDESEEVEEADKNPMYGVGAVIDTGIDYSSNIDTKNKNVYKERFEKTIIKLKQKQINEIAKGTDKSSNEKASDGYEIGD